VPGVVDLYEALLEERGQEITRLAFTPPAGAPATTTMRVLQRALAPMGAIPFAVELSDQRLVMAPPAAHPIPVAEMRGIYAVFDLSQAARAANRFSAQRI